MCMVLYLASDGPLPEIPWDEHRPEMHVERVDEQSAESDVRRQFTKSYVYYVGSYQRCGCGFGDKSREGEQSRRDLAGYLRAATRNSGPVEIYSCWTGAQGAEQLLQGTIGPEDIIDPDFAFEEQQFLTVVPN